MLQKILTFFVIFVGATNVALCADNTPIPDIHRDTAQPDTSCSTTVFANALAKTANTVDASDDETKIQQWIYQTFQNADVLRHVIVCPEFANASDDETIKLQTIQYTFPTGRNIKINYETQPKILNQRIKLAERRTLASDNNPNPVIGGPGDDSIWTNTDPAWYAIMVVESGSLDDFIGPGKNNTISMQYINDNIDKIFPHGNRCTSKSAIAGNREMINLAMHETVNIPDDTNDYYVAGDADLRWISYMEIGLDVAITVATMGTGTAILGTTKAARASRTLNGLTQTMRTLRQTESVTNYIRTSQQYARAMSELNQIDRVADATGYARKLSEVENYAQTMRTLENTDDVRRYRQASDTFASLNQYRRALRGLRTAQRGNIVARAWRAVRAANTGGRQIRNATKIARSSSFSGRIRDWLFQSTMSNIGALARMERTGGFIYGALRFVGGMYDWTETSTGEFTNDIEFKPLTLLSADDLQGQENVVNHGMWLMWAGDSVSPSDDDAAYLQAMDFADKFHFNLMAIQSEQGNHACNVDIFVVRPVIRNPGTEFAELYYLVMNDEPWTTHETRPE